MKEVGHRRHRAIAIGVLAREVVMNIGDRLIHGAGYCDGLPGCVGSRMRWSRTGDENSPAPPTAVGIPFCEQFAQKSAAREICDAKADQHGHAAASWLEGR